MTISFLWAVFKDRSSGVYEATFRVLIFVLCLDVFCDSKENTDYMLNTTIFAGVFYAVHVLMTTPVSYYGTLNVGVSVNAQRNFVGQVSALISIISFVLLMSENQRKKRCVYLFSMILCYFVACISGSRKAFLMLPLAVVLYMLKDATVFKEWMNGTGGFEQAIKEFILITAKRSVYMPHEINQYIVSASMYAAYLSLALHAYGLGACVVQRSVVINEKWERIRKILDIPGDEQAICLLGIGNLKDEYCVPVSHRLSEEVFVKFYK